MAKTHLGLAAAHADEAGMDLQILGEMIDRLGKCLAEARAANEQTKQQLRLLAGDHDKAALTLPKAA